MSTIEQIAERFIKEHDLNLAKARVLCDRLHVLRGKDAVTTAPIYGNALDWEEADLLQPDMCDFCVRLPMSDKYTLLQSGHVITTVTTAMPIVDIVTYCMYRALARTVWQMVEKMK